VNNDKDKLTIYGEMMDQIIKNDGFYGKILSKIRDGYDEWLT